MAIYGYYYYWILRAFGARAFEIQSLQAYICETRAISSLGLQMRAEILSLSEPLTLGVLYSWVDL